VNVSSLIVQLEESEDQYVQAEKRFHSLKGVLEDKEKELATAARKHQEALSASAASGTVVKQLEEAVQQYEATHSAHTQFDHVILRAPACRDTLRENSITQGMIYVFTA